MENVINYKWNNHLEINSYRLIDVELLRTVVARTFAWKSLLGCQRLRNFISLVVSHTSNNCVKGLNKVGVHKIYTKYSLPKQNVDSTSKVWLNLC